MKTCPAGGSSDTNYLRNSKMLIAPFVKTENKEVQEIFSKMKETKKYPGLKQVSENDELIKEFGKGLLQKLGTKDEQRLKDIDNIRTKVRHVARLLVALKEKDKEIYSLDNAITPAKFFLVIETVKDIAQECDSPKFGTTLGHYLKQLSMLKKSLALVSSDNIKHKQATDFGTLFDTHWNSFVSSALNRRMRLRTMNKAIKIPPTSDLVMFKDFLDDEIKKFVLLFPLSASEWGQFSKLLLVRLALFNKRRISEVAELKICDFSNRLGSSADHEEVFEQLDITEQILVKRMDLIEVRGKSVRGLRKVFIVLTQEMVQACEHLLKTRYHAKQNLDNPFLFSRPNSLGPIDGCTAMREITNLCEQLKEPNLIRSRLLRKYMATTIQILDMSRDELSTIADHMGHSVAVHTDVYRMQTSLQEKTKVARALIALENGKLSKFSGQTLSSITLEHLPIPTCDEPGEPAEYDNDDDIIDMAIIANNSETNDALPNKTNEPKPEFNVDIIANNSDKNDSLPNETNEAKPGFILTETSTDDVSSTTVISEGNLPRVQAPPRKRKRWDANEESILIKAFRSSFERSKNPSLSEITEAQNKYPVLKSRSAPVIKTKINNILLGKCKLINQ